MRRRVFIALLGGAATWPFAARSSSSERTRRIGVLMTIADDREGHARIAAFKSGLKTLGWIEGRNLHLDICWTNADPNRSSLCAAQLVRSEPDAILASAPPALTALRQVTSTIPVVYVQVGSGFFQHPAHPNGNVTGSTAFGPSVGSKWVQILHEIAPRVKTLGVLVDWSIPTHAGYVQSIQAAAQYYHLAVTVLDGSSAQNIRTSIGSLVGQSNGLIVLPSPISAAKRKLIIELAAKQKLPAIYPYRFYVADGGLVSYGNDNYESYRRAATQIDRVLRGTPVRDLPVQMPLKFALVINMDAAKTLGLPVPRTLLASANEVIK